ncbi:hypothetical protein [Haloferula sp.]|uniref:hypothetical protein n=1 Tax=Haloferula sp. TaxID=2497595 RepID=UPI003C74755D
MKATTLSVEILRSSIRDTLEHRSLSWAFLMQMILVAGSMHVGAQSRLDEVLEDTERISSLEFRALTTQFLPGKGKGAPAGMVGDLGIALIFAQNNYWTSNSWSAEGYEVKTGVLVDREGRLPQVAAYEVSVPRLAEQFSFYASGSDLFFEFPAADDYVVYSAIPKGEVVPSGKEIHDFKNHTVVVEARIAAADVVVGGFTKIPGMRLHDLKSPRLFFHLPESARYRADTAVATGVSAARISHTKLARATALKIDVSAAGAPENSHIAGRRPGDAYGAKPGLSSFANLDGGVSIAWKDTNDGRLRLTTVRADLSYETVILPGLLGRFSNVVRDGVGNLFYVNYDAGSSPQVQLIKTGPDGMQLLSVSQNTASGALNIAGMSDYWDSVRLCHAAGKLCVIYSRGMDNGHQGSIIVTYDAGNLSLMRNYGQNSSHSFDSRVIHDGTDFLNVSLGDNYPRGLILDRIRTSSKKGKVIYTYKTRHYESGLASNDNRTYTEVGDLLSGTEGHGVLFSSEASTDNALATGALNEARNIGYLLVAPGFDAMSQTEYMVPSGMILSEGTDSPPFGFYNFGGGYVRQQYRGVRWLTNYSDKETENASRPKMVGLADGRRLVLWEKWTPNSHVETQGLIMDPYGHVEVEASILDGLRISDGDGLTISGTRVFSVTANGSELEWQILELDQSLEAPIQILSQSIDRVAGRIEIGFVSKPGRGYRLETSTTMVRGSWSMVEGSAMVAGTESSLMAGAIIPGESSRFWRVAEID